MRALTIADSANITLGLQDEIRRSEESRHDRRLHGVLLVAQGMTCPEVARLLGDAPRTVEYWVGSFEESGLAGLLVGDRAGRPNRLDEKQLRGINAALRRMPRGMGLGGNLWGGKTLAAWIAKEYGIDLGVRQCQRLFRQFGSVAQAAPSIAQADPERQKVLTGYWAARRGWTSEEGSAPERLWWLAASSPSSSRVSALALSRNLDKYRRPTYSC
jgi:transposase